MREQVTMDGSEKIRRWAVARQRLRDAQSEVRSAECDVSNTTNALGRWLIPEDAKPGETFCVWWGDSLIQVEMLVVCDSGGPPRHRLLRSGEFLGDTSRQQPFALSIRTRGKTAAEFGL